MAVTPPPAGSTGSTTTAVRPGPLSPYVRVRNGCAPESS